jgi:hypothetical protein
MLLTRHAGKGDIPPHWIPGVKEPGHELMRHRRGRFRVWERGCRRCVCSRQRGRCRRGCQSSGRRCTIFLTTRRLTRRPLPLLVRLTPPAPRVRFASS